METKLSRKKIIILIVLGVIILGLLGGVLYYIFKPDPGIEVMVVNPEIKDVIETFDTSATVESSEEGKFTVVDGIMATKVNVKVGDIVKKGDVLVEFDSNSLNSALKEKQESLQQAKTAYNDYNKKITDASSKLSQTEKQIVEAEKLVAKLEKQVEASDTTKESSQTTEAENKLSSMTNDKNLSKKIVSLLFKNNYSMSDFIDILNKIDSSSQSVDLSSMIGTSITDSAQAKLIEAQLNLASLKISKALYETESKGNLLSVYKTIVDYAQDSYDELKLLKENMSKGWIAEKDGIVSEINIKAGEITVSEKSKGFDISTLINSVSSGTTDIMGILSSFGSEDKIGLVVQYYPLQAKFIIGQSNINNIDLGQSVKIITSSDEEIEGKVSYISAVATSSSNLDIGSLLSGGSSSSVTGVEAKVEIEKPTKDVIIGLDVNLSINIKKSSDAITVPVESIQYDSQNAFVYCVKDFKLYKQPVEVGLFDGSCYEIISGLNINDQIVKSPTSSMSEGMKVIVSIA